VKPCIAACVSSAPSTASEAENPAAPSERFRAVSTGPSPLGAGSETSPGGAKAAVGPPAARVAGEPIAFEAGAGP
jgi:hypothetical protein